MPPLLLLRPTTTAAATTTFVDAVAHNRTNYTGRIVCDRPVETNFERNGAEPASPVVAELASWQKLPHSDGQLSELAALLVLGENQLLGAGEYEQE